VLHLGRGENKPGADAGDAIFDPVGCNLLNPGCREKVVPTYLFDHTSEIKGHPDKVYYSHSSNARDRPFLR
jgi:hypothetical protein